VVVAMLAFVVVNLALVAINGVRQGGDTPLYLDGASRLLDGRPLVDREPSYPGYIAVIALFQALGVGLFGVVLVQIIAGAAATAAVYRMATELTGRVAGAIAAALVIVDVDTNRWHQFILADSLFISLSTIGVFLAHRAAIGRGLEPLVSALAVLLCAGLVRPEGWFLLPAAVGYMVMMRARSKAGRLAGGAALVTAGAALAAILAPAVSGNMQAVGPADMLRRGQTIWEYDGWRVAMPDAVASGVGQASSAFTYALDHPWSTSKLMLARVGVHFAHVRPFYSTPHNIAIVAWLLPVYAAAIIGAWRLRHAALTWWISAAIAAQTLVVALTHAEWDGRYLAHVLPLIYVLTGAALATLRRTPAPGAVTNG
jgi:hypothetical protein